MAVPKKKTSKMKKRQRRSHLHMRPNHLARCTQCGAAVMPHRVCHACGFYAGKTRVDMDEF